MKVNLCFLINEFFFNDLKVFIIEGYGYTEYYQFSRPYSIYNFFNIENKGNNKVFHTYLWNGIDEGDYPCAQQHNFTSISGS
jgi:hypothetical protein